MQRIATVDWALLFFILLSFPYMSNEILYSNYRVPALQISLRYMLLHKIAQAKTSSFR